MYSQVVYPDYQHQDVDWEYPEHEGEYRMRIIKETRVDCQALSFVSTQFNYEIKYSVGRERE
jgi:hypothetical protein